MSGKLYRFHWTKTVSYIISVNSVYSLHRWKGFLFIKQNFLRQWHAFIKGNILWFKKIKKRSLFFWWKNLYVSGILKKSDGRRKTSFYIKQLYQQVTFRKQSVVIKETDTLPWIGVVVVVTAKYKYLRLEKLRWIDSSNARI